MTWYDLIRSIYKNVKEKAEKEGRPFTENHEEPKRHFIMRTGYSVEDIEHCWLLYHEFLDENCAQWNWLYNRMHFHYSRQIEPYPHMEDCFKVHCRGDFPVDLRPTIKRLHRFPAHAQALKRTGCAWVRIVEICPNGGDWIACMKHLNHYHRDQQIWTTSRSIMDAIQPDWVLRNTEPCKFDEERAYWAYICWLHQLPRSEGDLNRPKSFGDIKASSYTYD